MATFIRDFAGTGKDLGEPVEVNSLAELIVLAKKFNILPKKVNDEAFALLKVTDTKYNLLYPTNGRFSVAVDAEADREVTLQVVGINGKVLYSKVYNLLRGNNLLNVDMGTSGFGKITAFVTLKANDAKYVTKQIVLE